MAGAARKPDILSNPFYVLLLAVSTLFVLTALGYLVSPYVLEAGRAPQGERSRAFAAWLDRNSPLILTVEFTIMLLTGILSMVTDHRFSKKPKSDSRPIRRSPEDRA